MKKSTTPILLFGRGYTDADFRYATGSEATEAYVFLHHGRKRIAVVSGMEVNRVRRYARRVQVLSAADLSLPRSKRGSLAEWAIRLLEREGVQRVKVSAGFPLFAARKLERAGIRLRMEKQPLYPARAVKTAAEVECIRQTQAAAARAMRKAMRYIREAQVDARGVLRLDGKPLRSEDVRLRIEETLLHEDCAAPFTIVAGGAQAADPHECGSGPLRAGEPIVIDIFPRNRRNGYHGDITRTVLKGRASEELARMYRAVRKAQEEALRTVRAGVVIKHIHEAVERVFEARGYPTHWEGAHPRGFIHSTGHGVGLEIHEAPRIDGRQEAVLRAGHIITIEPGLYYPDKGGIRIEDTILVTRTGWEPLAAVTKNFVIP